MMRRDLIQKIEAAGYKIDFYYHLSRFIRLYQRRQIFVKRHVYGTVNINPMDRLSYRQKAGDSFGKQTGRFKREKCITPKQMPQVHIGIGAFHIQKQEKPDRKITLLPGSLFITIESSQSADPIVAPVQLTLFSEPQLSAGYTSECSGPPYPHSR